MRKASLFGLGLGLLVFTTGCGDSPEKVMKDTISLMNDASKILESVKDEDSAKKAASDLEKLEKKGKDIQDRVKKLKMEDLSKEKKEALEKKFKDDFEKAMERLQKASANAAKYPELQKALQDLKVGR